MNDPVENPRIARNVLTNAALIRLTDWARQNIDSCQTLSNKTLATMAGETLNLHLTAANIASALEAVNITKIKPKAPPTLEERIEHLDTLTTHQTEVIASLCRDSERDAHRISELESAKGVLLHRMTQLEVCIRGQTIPTNIFTQLKLDQAQYTPPEPTQIQIIATDGPITVTPPMLRPGETLHGLPDLDTAVAEVKGERERNESPWEGPTLAEPQPIHQAADAIGGEP